MYSVSATYLNKIKEPSRIISSKVLVGTTTLTDDEIQGMSVEYSLGNDGIPGIGGVVSTRLTLRLLRIGNTPSYYTTQTIKPSVAIDDGVGNKMWVPLGTFYPAPDTVKRTDQTIEIECFDILTKFDTIMYETSLTFPISIRSVANEIATKYGIVFKDVNQLPNVNLKVKPDKQSVRGVLAELAELASANLVIDRDGKADFKTLKTVAFGLTADNYIDFTLESDNDVKITKLICEKGGQDANGNEIVDLEYGDTTGSTLRFTNDSISNATELKTVYDRMFPLTYTAYELKCQGMPHLEVGDIITLVDKKTNNYNLSILTHTIDYTGGMISTIGAKAPSTSNSTGSTGSNSISQAVDKVQANILTVNTILAGNITADNIAANAITADKIAAGAITADLIKAEVIQAINLSTETATIDSAKINTAEITTIVGQDIRVGTAQIVDAAITTAKIGTAAVDTAQIKDAAITNAKIGSLAVDTAKIKDASITNAKIGSLAVGTANIADAAITNAKIGNLAVDTAKIAALAVDSAKIKDAAITTAKIGDAQITTAKIGDAQITSAKIGSLAVGTANIADAAITNAKIGALAVDNAKIASLDAGKITTGTLAADRIAAGSIEADKISAAGVNAIAVSAGTIVANDIAAGTIKVGNANIVDGSISGAKITNASITNAQIKDATIDSAKIANLNASKINAGTLDASKVSISGTGGKLTMADNTITIKDAQATPVTRVQIGKDAQNNYGIIVVNAAGQAIFDSAKGVLLPEGLEANVVTTDKIKDDAVSPSKIQVDDLIASNAFINNFTAVSIDASQIKTGKITGERIDIGGLVSFEAFDEDLSNLFDVTGNKTYINGGMIAANTIKANSIDLLSGLTVKKADGTVTFAVANDGGVTVNGLLQSGNYVPDKSGYRIATDGTAEFNQIKAIGTVANNKAGITNDGTTDSSVRFWAGSDYAGRDTAPFRVTQKGDVYAANGTFTGVLRGTVDSGDIQIYNNAITVHSPGTETEVARINAGQTVLNHDVVFGSNTDKKFSFDNANRNLTLNTTSLNLNHAKGAIENNTSILNAGAIVGYNVLKSSHIDGGEHRIKYWNGFGGLIFESTGTNQVASGSSEKPYDFKFERAGGDANVKVAGKLEVTNSIHSSSQNIEMRSVSGEGWGFYAT